jgi:catechol 1,2-dioxygenase
MVVDLINHEFAGSATETTVLGPFYREGAPELPPGGNMGEADPTGVPLLISGRVTDPNGKPVANAVLDCWQASSVGLYDSQVGDGEALGMRGIYRTNSEGRYLLRTTKPKYYPIPTGRSRGRHDPGDQPASVSPRTRALPHHGRRIPSRW